ncbi:MAG: DUF4097 family beta strand repeat protein [Erysipelotrichales bacterium]|nr:DUF4097 family beta strand repeat protein [Erysipelotrichales bacterium]
MKNKGLIIFLIVLLSICCISLGFILYLGLSGKTGLIFSWNGFKNVSTENIYDNTYEEEFEKINIKTSASMIEFKQSKDGNTRVKIFGDGALLNNSDEFNILNIEYKNKPCIGICFNQSMAKIEIELPINYEGNITIDNKYGDVEIEEFIKSNINVSSSYGNTSIKGAYEVNINSEAGDINVGTASRAILNNNFGDIKVEKVLSYLDINDDCGDIKINEINIDTDSTIKNNLGDIKVNKSNNIRIEAKTSLGDEKIENNNYKSDIVLKITNDCGDIKVNN